MNYSAKWHTTPTTTIQELYKQHGSFEKVGLLLHTHKKVIRNIYTNNIPHLVINYCGGLLLVKATPAREAKVRLGL